MFVEKRSRNKVLSLAVADLMIPFEPGCCIPTRYLCVESLSRFRAPHAHEANTYLVQGRVNTRVCALPDKRNQFPFENQISTFTKLPAKILRL